MKTKFSEHLGKHLSQNVKVYINTYVKSIEFNTF